MPLGVIRLQILRSEFSFVKDESYPEKVSENLFDKDCHNERSEEQGNAEALVKKRKCAECQVTNGRGGA